MCPDASSDNQFNTKSVTEILQTDMAQPQHTRNGVLGLGNWLFEIRNLCYAGEGSGILRSLASPGSELIVVPDATHEALTYYFSELAPAVLLWLAVAG